MARVNVYRSTVKYTVLSGEDEEGLEPSLLGEALRNMLRALWLTALQTSIYKS